MIRRTTLTLMVSLIVIPPLTGCSIFKKKKTADLGQSTTVASYDQPAYGADTSGSYDPYAGQAAQAEPAYQPVAAPSSTAMAGSNRDYYQESTTLTAASGSRYHTVAKSDTLYGLARLYYSDASKWKAIYQANQDQLIDPNRIFVGQRLMIP